MSGKKVTMKDVAAAASVSPATVSLVLGGRAERIPESTCARVFAAAERLGYRKRVTPPHAHIRTIGVVCDSINIFFSQVLNGIISRAWARGYQVLQVGYSQFDGDTNAVHLRQFIEHEIQGIVLPHSAIPSVGEIRRAYDLARNAGVPALTMDVEIDGFSSRADTCDHVRDGYLATKHLLDCGHRRIGAISGPVDYVSSNMRLKGYRMALEEAGIPFNSDLVYRGNYKIQSGQLGLPHLLGQGATGIFAFNDMIALGIYKEVKRYGLSIPGDISVVGSDDIFVADVLETPLTTVHVPIEQIGMNAADELIDMVEGKPRIASRVIEPTLMVRGSTRLIS